MNYLRHMRRSNNSLNDWLQTIWKKYFLTICLLVFLWLNVSVSKAEQIVNSTKEWILDVFDWNYKDKKFSEFLDNHKKTNARHTFLKSSIFEKTIDILKSDDISFLDQFIMDIKSGFKIKWINDFDSNLYYTIIREHFWSDIFSILRGSFFLDIVDSYLIENEKWFAEFKSQDIDLLKQIWFEFTDNINTKIRFKYNSNWDLEVLSNNNEVVWILKSDKINEINSKLYDLMMYLHSILSKTVQI